MRTNDIDFIAKSIEPYRHEIYGFDISEWIDKPSNIALTNDDGDLALFYGHAKGMVMGHYFFKSRGKTAIKNAKEMMKELFEGYDVSLLCGLTPLRIKQARWMNRQLGLKVYDTIRTAIDTCEYVAITKQEWENMNE